MSIVNTPEQGNADAVTEPVNEVPEKLRDKSPSELAAMYQSLEKKLGQQSDELGQLRVLANQAVTAPTESAAEDVDFYTDPEKAVDQRVEQKIAQALAPQRMKETETILDSKHPGWRDTVKSEEFREWVGKSKARQSLYFEADDGHADAASELFEWWTDRKGGGQSAEDKAKAAVEKDRTIRKASTEKGSGKIDGRKILYREDLIELQVKNPSRYQALAPDIRKAHLEGRVKNRG